MYQNLMAVLVAFSILAGWFGSGCQNSGKIQKANEPNDVMAGVAVLSQSRGRPKHYRMSP